MRRRQPVTLVTSASQDRGQEIDARRRKYMITMLLRTVLFVLSVFLFRGTLRWIAVAFSMIAPFGAVVFANAGPTPSAGVPEYVTPEPLRELSAEPEPGPDRTIDG